MPSDPTWSHVTILEWRLHWFSKCLFHAHPVPDVVEAAWNGKADKCRLKEELNYAQSLGGVSIRQHWPDHCLGALSLLLAILWLQLCHSSFQPLLFIRILGKRQLTKPCLQVSYNQQLHSQLAFLLSKSWSLTASHTTSAVGLNCPVQITILSLDY